MGLTAGMAALTMLDVECGMPRRRRDFLELPMFGLRRLSYKPLANDWAKFAALRVGITFAVLRMIEMLPLISRSWIMGPVLLAICRLPYRSRGLPFGIGIANEEGAGTFFFFAAFGFFTSLLPRF